MSGQFGWFLRGFVGIGLLLLIAYLFSFKKKKINWKLVGVGIGFQFVFALLMLKTKAGQAFFGTVNDVVLKLLSFSDKGSEFLFGSLINYVQPTADGSTVVVLGAIFAFKVLPTIIFFSSLISVLYFLGVMQFVVKVFAWVMQKALGTSGAETLSCSANIFVGQTEAPLIVKPYVETMTKSELITIMTGGFATVAGGVMAAYVGMLVDQFPEIAGHLLSASIMNAPAAIYLSKMIYPEEEEPLTKGDVKVELPITDANLVDAAANGAGQGLQLALNVGAMLLAFIALIAMINFALSGVVGILLGNPDIVMTTDANTGTKVIAMVNNVIPRIMLYRVLVFLGLAIIFAMTFLKVESFEGMLDKVSKMLGMKNKTMAAGAIGGVISLAIVLIGLGIGSGFGDKIPYKEISLSYIFGWIFWPIAWAIGVPAGDCQTVGAFMGERLVINEFVAYANLSAMLKSGAAISPRAIMITTYALCGFANFSSIAIQIGGIGGLAPSRRSDLSKLGFHGVVAGTLATFMSACIAGMLVSESKSMNLKVEKPAETKAAPTEEAPADSSFNIDFNEYYAKHLGIKAEKETAEETAKEDVNEESTTPLLSKPQFVSFENLSKTGEFIKSAARFQSPLCRGSGGIAFA